MAIATIGTDVYVALFFDGIVSIPAAGGAVTPLAPVAGTGTYLQNVFAFDDDSLYWSQSSGGYTSGPIVSAPIGGGSPTSLTSSMGFTSGIVVDATRVYWVDQDQGTVNSIPLAGGTPFAVATGLKTPGGLTLHDGTLYLTDAAGDLLSVPATGGAVTTLVTGPGVPANVVVADWSPPVVSDGSNLYFSTCAWDGTTPADGLYRVPFAGGTPQLLASACAAGIAVDDTDVYWVDRQSIQAVPIAGGAVRQLAAGESISGGPALDQDSVYWGITPQIGSCGICPPPPQGQVNAVMKAPKSSLH